MREEKIYDYFAFGFNYFAFEDNGCIYADIHKGEDSLRIRLDEFFEDLDNLNMLVTKMAASDLQKIREKIKNFPEDSTVDKELAEEIKNIALEIGPTLDAELKLRNAYIVMPKRYSLEYLLETPHNLFAKDVFVKLPDLSKYDFSEACKCIAFILPTAAAFHLMRGTEGVLRFYYSNIVKRGRVKRLMWGDMVNSLRTRRNPPPKTLLDNLDNIRVNFRNPTQHPDAKYDLDEVQDLLALSIDVVNRLVKDLP